MTRAVRFRLDPRPAVLAAMVIGIVLTLIVLLALELRSSYRREVDAAAAVTQSIARILERQLLASMDRIDLLVQEAAFQYAAHRAGNGLPAGEMDAMLARHLARVPGLLSLRLINEKGDYVFDASGSVSPANIADRRYFRAQRDAPDRGLFPEGPLFSRVVSQWTLTFSRGVRASDNRFLGIVQSSIQTDALAGAFEKVSQASSDSVTLFNGDGALVARHPNLPEQIGTVAISDRLRSLIKAQVDEATYSGASGADGIQRLYTVRRVGLYPFYILVGMSYDRILAEWRRTAYVYGLISSALLLGSILLASRIFVRYSATVRLAEEQRQLTSEVFANALEGIVVTDAAARIISANQAMCDATGYEREELVGATPALFRSNMHDQAFFQGFWSVLTSEGRWQGEIWNRRKSGAVFPEWLSVSRISDGAGHAIRYVGIYTDISEQKAAQQKLQFNNAELFRLTEVMAHHLQEPTRRLVTFSQKLKAAIGDAVVSEDAAISLAFIAEQAAKLRALIRDIQLYLAADQPMGEIRPLDLAAVVAAVMATRADELAAIGAETRIDPDLPDVVLDHRRLGDLIGILLDNAIRYRRPETPLRIHVSAASVNQMVQLRFSDNGCGIPEMFRERVFSVFERLRPQSGEDSTGIGLAILRRVAEQGNGRTWIEETPGGGTTVVLELPAGMAA